MSKLLQVNLPFSFMVRPPCLNWVMTANFLGIQIFTDLLQLCSISSSSLQLCGISSSSVVSPPALLYLLQLCSISSRILAWTIKLSVYNIGILGGKTMTLSISLNFIRKVCKHDIKIQLQNVSKQNGCQT